MNITLYKNAAKNIEVNKVQKLSGAITRTGTLKKNTSVVSPVIEVNEDIGALSYYNYMYVPAFHRYYYILDKITTDGNCTELHCKSDVLMSMASGIMSTTQFIERQENDYNRMLTDNQIPTEVDTEVNVIHFNKKPFLTADQMSLTEHNIVLQTVGSTYTLVPES